MYFSELLVHLRRVQADSFVRLLRGSGLRSQHPYRHVVVGFLLDRHRRHSRAGVAGTPHRAHHDNAEYRRTQHAPTRVLHQGHRRLDGSLPHFRFCRAFGVCLRERADEGGEAQAQIGDE